METNKICKQRQNRGKTHTTNIFNIVINCKQIHGVNKYVITLD